MWRSVGKASSSGMKVLLFVRESLKGGSDSELKSLQIVRSKNGSVLASSSLRIFCDDLDAERESVHRKT